MYRFYMSRIETDSITIRKVTTWPNRTYFFTVSFSRIVPILCKSNRPIDLRKMYKILEIWKTFLRNVVELKVTHPMIYHNAVGVKRTKILYNTYMIWVTRRMIFKTNLFFTYISGHIFKNNVIYKSFRAKDDLFNRLLARDYVNLPVNNFYFSRTMGIVSG